VSSTAEEAIDYTLDIRRHPAVRALAFELAELTCSPDQVPDAEDWEMAELLFLSRQDQATAPHTP
jgi:hypothetical protein